MQLYSHYKKPNTYQKDSFKPWKDRSLNKFLIYSCRKSLYDAGNFPSSLHYHDYFELTVIENGNVKYICESEVFSPKKGDIILKPPGNFHMSVIGEEKTQYNRHVFYFYTHALDDLGYSCLFDFAKKEKNGAVISLPKAKKEKLLALLDLIEGSLSHEENEMESALGFSYIIQFLYLLNKEQIREDKSSDPPP